MGYVPTKDFTILDAYRKEPSAREWLRETALPGALLVIVVIMVILAFVWGMCLSIGLQRDLLK